MPKRLEQIQSRKLTVAQELVKGLVPMAVGFTAWAFSNTVRPEFWNNSKMIINNWNLTKFFADSGADMGFAIAATGVALLTASALTARTLSRRAAMARDAIVATAVPLYVLADEMFLHHFSETRDLNDFTALLGVLILMPAVTLLFDLCCKQGISLKSLKRDKLEE